MYKEIRTLEYNDIAPYEVKELYHHIDGKRFTLWGPDVNGRQCRMGAYFGSYEAWKEAFALAQKKSKLVKFCPGNGKKYMLPVDAVYSNGPQYNDACAFCQGDPCAESSGPETPIGEYMAGSETYKPDTCPICHGAPS